MKSFYEKVLVAVVGCELVGVAGSYFTMPSIPVWYSNLVKPSYAPPGAVIGLIWLVLYALMGVSLALVWNSNKHNKARAYWVFGVQLFLNFVWSVLFFWFQSPILGLVDIALLWVAIVATGWVFWRFSERSVELLVPYLLWVSIAASLNYWIVVLN